MNPNKEIVLNLTQSGKIVQFDDPIHNGMSYFEALLPFSEASKLDPGNANVRPAGVKRPFKAMERTLVNSPQLFHVMNRGITYICDAVEIDQKNQQVHVLINGGNSRYGIADGGHTFRVITEEVERMRANVEFGASNDPFVRVRFLSWQDSKEGDIEQIVEALNTSVQVQSYTLEEYRGTFDELKRALKEANFDPELVAFKENEQKPWQVREVIQRMACFLRERWANNQPVSMYSSKGKALQLFLNEETRGEFRELYPVVKEILTLPELIQSEFSALGLAQIKKLEQMRIAKKLAKEWSRPGTDYRTHHRLDLAAALPIASAFRGLLTVKRNGAVGWTEKPETLLPRCIPGFYEVLVTAAKKVNYPSQLSFDHGFWTACYNVVLKASR